MSENKQPSAEKALEYWKDNAKEDYITTPISVLRYIGELEAEIKELKEERDLNKVNRVEVIDAKGRSYVNWNDKNDVSISMQDDNRTMKIFIQTKQP